MERILSKLQDLGNNVFIGRLNRLDTNILKFNQENRLINKPHLSKIKDQIRASLNLMPPITININTLCIIDGQHRLTAFQQLVDKNEIPNDSTILVMFVNVGLGTEKQAIVNANSNSKNWSVDDYMESYAKTNQHYSRLQSWCDGHVLCKQKKKRKYRYAAAMMKGRICSKELKDGTFVINEGDLYLGNLIHNELFEISKIMGLPSNGMFYEAMAIEWHKYRNKYLFNKWIESFKKNKKLLKGLSFSNQNDWDTIFSKIETKINS